MASNVKAEIGAELLTALSKLGAEASELGIVGSYGGAVATEDIVEALRRWNDEHNPKALKPDPTNVDAVFAEELYVALAALNAPSELLGIIGSWGDGYDDEQTLAELRKFNSEGTTFDDISVDLRNADGQA